MLKNVYLRTHVQTQFTCTDDTKRIKDNTKKQDNYESIQGKRERREGAGGGRLARGLQTEMQ